MRYLFTLFCLFPLFASAQVDTIVIEGRASQLYSAMSTNGLRNASLLNPPTVGRDNFPVGVVLANSRATFYIWRNTCPSNLENSTYMHIGPTGCWQQATNSYLAADWCLIRVGDTFRIDMQCLWDSLNYYYPIAGEITSLKAKVKSDSLYAAQTYAKKTDVDTAFWNNAARQWNARKASIVYTDSFYSNPPWLTSVDISKVPNAATQNFVTTGINTLKAYSDNTFQPKGNYLTTPQTLTLSGSSLGITNGNTVALPKQDTTAIYAAIAARDPSSTNELQSLSLSGSNLTISNGNTITLPSTATNLGSSVSGQNVTITSSTGTSTTFAAPSTTYTAGTGIIIASNVISTTGLRTLAMPNVVVAETALVSLSAGVRNVVVTCTGVLAGDIVTITPLSAPAGYMVGAAVATANNQLTVQLSAPLLAVGTNYSITCKVAVHRP